MNNFSYYNPVRIEFGRGTIAKLADLIPPDERVLMVYGGGSIKKNGVYDQVKKALAGRVLQEFGGVEANPQYATLIRAVEVVRSKEITFILAVGGGSVLDGVKFIAAAARFEGEPWDILEKNAEVKAAVPLGTVMTLPATGSETNTFAVISRVETRQKLAFGAEACYPIFAILDPETTLSLPDRQVANGIVDAFIHVLEQYLTCDQDAPLQDRQAEGILLTLIDQTERVLKDPKDYAIRANIMWSATQALNGLIGVGVAQDWATHMIGHELTALFGIDHARTLAVVLPSLLRHEKANKKDKLLQYAARVWGISDGDDDTVIEQGIRKTEAFFHRLGVPTRLSDHQVDLEQTAPIVARFSKQNARMGETQSIDAVAVEAILRASA
ncbi:MAG: NADH-dependent alcohol dehydrogenase [Verrucomicrobia bacterium]|nr:MAG: NADH-dependent alcohol dehydrogenase [Verrucomicrobiota bacterium]